MMSNDSRQGHTVAYSDFRWWRHDGQIASVNAEPLGVSIESLLEKKWCSVRRVTIGATPHKVQFCRPSHTLMIFDRGSFVEGERWVNGIRLGATGPLDIGIDVAPANSSFAAVAGPGSNITCNLITCDEEAITDAFGTRSHEHPLRPALNLGGELLLPLAARLRQLCRDDPERIDNLHLESIVVLLYREISLAQDQQHTFSRPLCAGGLSSRAQRIVRDFLHENFEKRIDLEMLAELVGVSRFHFIRAFKASFSVPPYRYLLNLRIRKAADLLRETQIPVTEVALDVGFSCSSEFARAFKQLMNCSPREFRSENRKTERLATV
jgi:AraC-like DNA-binding protein